MCSICGMIDFYNRENITEVEVTDMGKTMHRRGPDAHDTYVCENVAFHHNRLAVIDVENGSQPMKATVDGREFVIVYNGEIYNSADLRAEMEPYGFKFETDCDTETVLKAYICFGEECPKKLNGIFAFAVYDKNSKKVFMARDRLGVKPFFYSLCGTTLLFASECKALLKHKSVSSKIDMYGLWQLLFLAPVTVEGSGVFKDIKELKSGQCATFDKTGLRIRTYWQLKAEPFNSNAVTAAKTTEQLLTDAIKRQLVSDVPLCTFLSGGLDSSVITAVASKHYKEQGNTLDTYSFEYENNKQNFKESLFQPQGDDEFAVFLADWLKTNHTVLTAPNLKVAESLPLATFARDLPGQADIDSSLLYFCKKVKENHTVAISGECSDEIFGGYPWFYRPEMLYRDFFPWIHDPMARASLFKDGFAEAKKGYKEMSAVYKKTIENCPTLPTDTDDMRTSRIATCLSVKYFMSSLLERKDRMSMYSGLEVRVPFADHRIIEYVYNVPWDIKFRNGVEKALLRSAMSNWLPSKILYRKKSPYPKTHSPEYTEAVYKMLKARLDKGGILKETLKPDAIDTLLRNENKTWFGQLMSTPQLLAWLVQFDVWFEKYNVDIEK